jgi:hypothetical protein
MLKRSGLIFRNMLYTTRIAIRNPSVYRHLYILKPIIDAIQRSGCIHNYVATRKMKRCIKCGKKV